MPCWHSSTFRLFRFRCECETFKQHHSRLTVSSNQMCKQIVLDLWCAQTPYVYCIRKRWHKYRSCKMLLIYRWMHFVRTFTTSDTCTGVNKLAKRKRKLLESPLLSYTRWVCVMVADGGKQEMYSERATRNDHLTKCSKKKFRRCNYSGCSADVYDLIWLELNTDSRLKIQHFYSLNYDWIHFHLDWKEIVHSGLPIGYSIYPQKLLAGFTHFCVALVTL